MIELIKVLEKDGEKLVSARELHEFLEVGRDFSTWIKERIAKFGFEEGIDFSPILGNSTESTGRPKIEYVLKLDMAKELSMVENNEKGRQARKYFIEVEKQFNKQKLPQTYKEALLELVRVEEEREQLLLLNKEQQETIDYQQETIIHKEDVIISLVDETELANKRQRITQIVRFRSKNYQDRYRLLYHEFEKKFHVNLEMRLERYNKKNKPKLKNKMDLIEKMNMIPQLYEICVKIFERDFKLLLEEMCETIQDI